MCKIFDDKTRKHTLSLPALPELSSAEHAKKREHKKWRKKNRDAIAAYNEYVDTNGVFSNTL